MEIFNNLCRACNTKQNKLLNIFTEQQNESTTIKNMLEYCLLMPIHNEDMYPELICYFCIKELEISYRFLQRFKLAQNEFQNSYEHIKNIQHKNEDADNQCEIEEEICQDFKSYNEYNELPEHQIIDEIKPTNITVAHLESVRNKHTIEHQNAYAVINTAKFENLPAVTCSICKKSFFTAKALNLHLKISHKKTIDQNTRNVYDNCKKIENADEKTFKHPRTDVEMEYTQLNASVRPIEIAQFIPAIEVEQKSDAAKNCSVCHKSFLTVKALNLHLKLSHKQKITIT